MVLESPFSCLGDEVERVVGRLWATLLPVSSLLRGADMQFSSTTWLPRVAADTLVLHAKDDSTVHYTLAQNLVSSAKKSGKLNIKEVYFEEDLKLGHNDIYTHPNFQSILTKCNIIPAIKEE